MKTCHVVSVSHLWQCQGIFYEVASHTLKVWISVIASMLECMMLLWVMQLQIDAPYLQHKVPMPNVLEGRQKGYGLAPVYCNASAPDKKVSPAVHAYHTHAARQRTGRIAQKNTYEGRVTMPNTLVARGADKKDIENVGWMQNRSTMHNHYLKVCWQLAMIPVHGTLHLRHSLQQ